MNAISDDELSVVLEFLTPFEIFELAKSHVRTICIQQLNHRFMKNELIRNSDISTTEWVKYYRVCPLKYRKKCLMPRAVSMKVWILNIHDTAGLYAVRNPIELLIIKCNSKFGSYENFIQIQKASIKSILLRFKLFIFNILSSCGFDMSEEELLHSKYCALPFVTYYNFQTFRRPNDMDIVRCANSIILLEYIEKNFPDIKLKLKDVKTNENYLKWIHITCDNNIHSKKTKNLQLKAVANDIIKNLTGIQVS